MAQVQLRNISKAFDRTAVLKGVDLTIADGEFLALVGPSGCGKSTLLRIVAGLERQTSGTVAIGRDVVDDVLPADRNLAMVFQSYALYPHLNVFDNIAVPLRMRRLSSMERIRGLRWLVPGSHGKQKKIADDVTAVAELLGMTDLLMRKPSQLSGGQRQRVAVGRAIVREPRAFLLDEPLSNLDAKLRVHMRTEIAQLHRRLGATFVYVTHDQAEAMTMSDRIAVMMDGSIVQIGSPDEIYDDPQDIRVAEFIGSPKMNIFEAVVAEQGVVLQGNGKADLKLEAAPGSPIRIGVRPEKLRLTDPAIAMIKGRLVHRENLGSEVLAHVAIEGQRGPSIVRVEQGRELAAGETIGLTFSARDVRAFDGSGHRKPVAETTEPTHD